jgi:hypothetical protein
MNLESLILTNLSLMKILKRPILKVAARVASGVINLGSPIPKGKSN